MTKVGSPVEAAGENPEGYTSHYKIKDEGKP